MGGQTVNTKLGAVIPRAVLANKTGENDTVSHDLGYILLPRQNVSIGVFTTSAGAPLPSFQSVADPYVQRIGTAVYEYLLATPPAPAEQPGDGTVSDPADPAAPEAAADAPALAETGADTALPIGLAVALVLAGAGALLARRERSAAITRR